MRVCVCVDREPPGCQGLGARGGGNCPFPYMGQNLKVRIKLKTEQQRDGERVRTHTYSGASTSICVLGFVFRGCEKTFILFLLLIHPTACATTGVHKTKRPKHAVSNTQVPLSLIGTFIPLSSSSIVTALCVESVS